MPDRSMIVRTRFFVLVFLLVQSVGNFGSSNALQYQTLDTFSTTEECALVLDGPGRSNAYDYTYNLLRGNAPPSAGSHTCITYEAVNRAYIEARKRVNVAQPHGDSWRPEDLATIGELLLDISTNLAHTYGLSYEEIQKSLPLIDTSKTLIREVCPAYLSDVECRPGKYRRYDGLCTNLENPTWGATLSPFTRLLSPAFPDGLSAPRVSVTGENLPLSRIVSRTMHPDEGYHDHAGTVMVIAWGQFMDHDYTLTGTPLDPMNRNDPEECCHRPAHQKNPYCNEIVIPEDDYFYRLFGVRCMDFVRAFPAARPGCRLGSRVPFNLLTGVLDGNTVYGVSEAFSRKLRTGYGGLLRMNPVFSEYGLKDLLPLKLDIPDEGCTRPNRSMYCFEAGEIRVNEQLVLACMHTLLAREHNRAAKALAEINPHWEDEIIFQESRRIVIAEIQHITYNEFLPILLGKDVMQKFGLLLEKHDYWDGYDRTVNPGVIDAFAAAAFRFGHSLLPTAVERWSKAHKFIASKRLSDLIRRPWDLYRAGVLDEYLMGLMNQVAQAMDDSITQEVTNHLFKKVGARFGMDLVSFNMQRGREFGIPGYMEFRKFCGLPGADTFEGLFGSMSNETIRRYTSIFQHPSDVDLWSGGVSERPLPGSMLGPTFACVIATQFSYSRRGDRFWYELPNQPSSFTLDQLNEIRKARLARLICDNTDLIDTIQLYPMVLPDHEINPRVPCRSGILPGIDFTKWAEYPTTSHAAKYATRFVDPLPLPVVHAAINGVGRAPASNKTKSGTLGEELPVAIDLIYQFVKNRGKDNGKSQEREQNTTSSTSINHPRSGNNDPDFENISTIVEHIRRRSKQLIDAQTLSVGKANFTERRKRSTRTKNVDGNPKTSRSPIIAEIPNNAPKLTILYRHPRLTLEEQQRQMPRNIDERSKGRKTRADNVSGNDEDKKSLYEPILKECDDTTAASELEDLNIPPPRARSVRRKKPIIADIDFPDREFDFLRQRKIDSDPSKTDESKETKKSNVSSRDSSALRDSSSINATYVNLRDHQKESREKTLPSETTNNSSFVSSEYPKDIPPYNPEAIPYVEVPDYTDQREESLDEDDRRAAKEQRYANDDSETTPAIGDEDALLVHSDKPATSDVLLQPLGNIDTLKNNRESEKSLLELYEDAPRDREIDLSSRVADDRYDDDHRARNEGTDAKSDEKSIEEPSRTSVQEANVETNITKHEEDDNDKGNIEGIADYQTANFDIDDYIKPYDFGKLFDEDTRKSDFFTDDSREETASEKLVTDVASPPEVFPKTYGRSRKFDDFFFDDKDFFKSSFDQKNDKGDHFSGESDFLSRYFNDDIIKKLDDNDESNGSSRDEGLRKSSQQEDREEPYKALSTSLKNEKNYKPNTADNVEKGTRVADESGEYNKFWTLEYAFPPHKINDALREEESAEHRTNKTFNNRSN